MAKSQTSSKKELKSVILTAYMDAVVGTRGTARNLYISFASLLRLMRRNSTSIFHSIDAVAAAVWSTFHENTLLPLKRARNLRVFESRKGVDAIYLPFLRTSPLNRSYVAFVLSEVHSNWKELKMLKGLRTNYKGFIEGLIAEENELSQVVSLNTTSSFLQKRLGLNS
jgi:hypothetical protein